MKLREIREANIWKCCTYFPVHCKGQLKLTSHGILHYLCSADLSKSFSQLLVSIFIFSQYVFSIDFVWCKKIFSIACVNFYLFSVCFFNRFCLVEKDFLNCLCQFVSFINFFFNRICPVEKCGVTPHCLSREVVLLYVKGSRSLTNLLLW